MPFPAGFIDKLRPALGSVAVLIGLPQSRVFLVDTTQRVGSPWERGRETANGEVERAGQGRGLSEVVERTTGQEKKRDGLMGRCLNAGGECGTVGGGVGWGRVKEMVEKRLRCRQAGEEGLVETEGGGKYRFCWIGVEGRKSVEGEKW